MTPTPHGQVPEALRLAEEISNLVCSSEAAAKTIAAAADELCRLHVENASLRAQQPASPPVEQQAAQVIIDFSQVGTAGPFPVVNGRVSLPDATMLDLVHMLRPTYEAEQQAKGLPSGQEPKYTVDGNSVVNRHTGEAIPHDEPIFVFRARDALSVRALEAYLSLICEREPSSAHAEAVRARIADFRRFANTHQSSMKWPDTATQTVKSEPLQQAAPQPAPMSSINRLIAYSATEKLRELGFNWSDASKAWTNTAPQPAPAPLSESIDQLARKLEIIGVVGVVDGHDVVRRESVLEIARRAAIAAQGGKDA